MTQWRDPHPIPQHFVHHIMGDHTKKVSHLIHHLCHACPCAPTRNLELTFLSCVCVCFLVWWSLCYDLGCWEGLWSLYMQKGFCGIQRLWNMKRIGVCLTKNNQELS